MSIWYGNLTNRIEERTKSLTPEVGMGATEYLYSDRHAWEIIAVKDERHCTARRLKTKIVGDWYEQNYEYESDENGQVIELFKTKKGRWVERHGREYGDWTFRIGYASEYYDPSF